MSYGPFNVYSFYLMDIINLCLLTDSWFHFAKVAPGQIKLSIPASGYHTLLSNIPAIKLSVCMKECDSDKLQIKYCQDASVR